jgi:hypothetical protein
LATNATRETPGGILVRPGTAGPDFLIRQRVV